MTDDQPGGGQVTLDILGPAHGGTAVARLDGRPDGQVVFVRGALPGEKGVPVHLAPAREGKRFLTAEVAGVGDIAVPSPHRVPPVCPAAEAGAGCCDLDFVDDVGSLALKRQVLVEQFRRIGHVELGDDVIRTVSAEPLTGYRTRVRLGVDGGGRAGLRRRNSNGIIALDDAGLCAQWDPRLADGLVGELAAVELTPGAEVCVAVGDDGGRSIVEIPPVRRPRGRRKEHGRGRGRGRRYGRDADRPVQRRILGGSGHVLHTVGGTSWSVPAESFWQAHRSAAGLYSAWVTDNTPPDTDLAWDLYGGAGVFAAALLQAAPGAAVDCVDIASPATEAGRTSLGSAGVTFVTGDVAGSIDALRGTEPGVPQPSVVVLDPPRTGAGADVVRTIAAHRPRVVLHIGCDPATAARDAAAFVANGYRPDSVTVVDAFGLTHHVEVLVRYTRRDVPAAKDVPDDDY